MTKWDQLIAAREQMHLSQLEAAERLQVGLVTYQRWEAGRRKPQPQHMRRLSGFFGNDA
jgi:transcriptional regulator with XRE-family HTH domain